MDVSIAELFLMAAAIVVGVLITLVIANCLVKCTDRRSRKFASSAEPLPEHYVKDIQRLLDRHKKVQDHNEYSTIDINSFANSSRDVSGMDTSLSTPLPDNTSTSRCDTPVVALRSRNNSERLRKLKVELEQYRADSPKQNAKVPNKDYETIKVPLLIAAAGKPDDAEDVASGSGKRRTWSDVRDSVFDLLPIPSVPSNVKRCSEVAVQTTETLERSQLLSLSSREKKRTSIETTV